MNPKRIIRRRWGLALAMAVMPLFTQAAETKPTADTFTPSEEIQDLITDLAREQLPDKYEKSKNWGKTTRVFAGWKVERRGLKIETRRRWKEANDGAWQKYGIDLVKPEKHFDVHVANIRQEGNKALCDIAVVAQSRVWGRHSQWENGVQLFSLSAEADARLRLTAQVEGTLRLDLARFPPDVILEPRVISADVQVLDFKLRRIGQVEGPVVKTLSSSVREMLEDKIADDRRDLVKRLNKSLAGQKDKLRFSSADALKSQWGEMVKQATSEPRP